MGEVRRHTRKTASGKTTTVRHHTRDTGSAGGDAERARAAWADRVESPALHVSTLRPAEPTQDESFWDDSEERPAGDFWAEEEPQPSAAFLSMQENMREWRSRPEPDVSGAVPDTSPLGRVLGTDTQQGAERFARLSAYRDAGYDGPLNRENRIPDPDDPAERPALEMLAALSETHG